MEVFEVNRSFLYYSKAEAIEKAKQIIRERCSPSETLSEKWLITRGKKNGICVRNLDDWIKVGNLHYLSVVITCRTLN